LETRNYEMMFVASPALDEEALESVLQRIQRYFETAGTQVFSFKSWGMRRLAYIIKGQREGRYYLVKFAAPTEAVNDLDRNVRMVEGILRHITVHTDEELVPESVEEVAVVEAEPAPTPEPVVVEETPAETLEVVEDTDDTDDDTDTDTDTEA